MRPFSFSLGLVYLVVAADETGLRESSTTNHHTDVCVLELDSLFVDPDYRGRGIGSSLVRWGNHLADHMMLPIWLEASTTGHDVYLRQGFHDWVHCKLTMGKWVIEYSLMKRDPKSTQIEIGTGIWNGSKVDGH